jgi:hypothetical protein
LREAFAGQYGHLGPEWGNAPPKGDMAGVSRPGTGFDSHPPEAEEPIVEEVPAAPVEAMEILDVEPEPLEEARGAPAEGSAASEPDPEQVSAPPEADQNDNADQ